MTPREFQVVRTLILDAAGKTLQGVVEDPGQAAA